MVILVTTVPLLSYSATGKLTSLDLLHNNQTTNHGFICYQKKFKKIQKQFYRKFGKAKNQEWRRRTVPSVKFNHTVPT